MRVEYLHEKAEGNSKQENPVHPADTVDKSTYVKATEAMRKG